MIALIMAGGSGTRFWPLSRKSRPKQFLNITGDESMIQLTVNRLAPLIDINDIYIVTSADQALLVQEHLPHLPSENIIIEPFGRNTAPCIALSNLYLSKKYASDECVLVLPADHVIKEHDVFIKSLHTAAVAAAKNNLVTFGITPSYPATGYGYIEAAPPGPDTFQNVLKFKEKPAKALAEKFLAAGNFYWNSGMFMWRLDTIQACFNKYLPQTNELLEQIDTRWQAAGVAADISDIYALMPRVPIDIGIMEKAEKHVVIPVDYTWSDVGGWKALYELQAADNKVNVANTLLTQIDSKANYVYASKPVALIGVDDLVIVETADAILIAKKDRAEEVKKIYETLAVENPELV